MSNRVVSNSDVKKALGLHGVFGSIMVSLGYYICGFHKTVKYLDNATECQGQEFVTRFLDNMKVSAVFDKKQLSNIPVEGSFVIVCNHPFGGIEGLLLYKIVSEIRPDFKLMANYLLAMIPNFKDSIFGVNPFTSNPEWSDSKNGLRGSIKHLAEGHGLGIFPAGEVSRYHGNSYPEDLPWSSSVARLIKNANVPVVPIFWEGQNSRMFYRLDKVHKKLSLARLPKELANKRGQCISLQIGKPIPAAEIAKFERPEDLAAYLRARTYALEANSTWPSQETTVTAPIETSSATSEIELELNRCREKSLLFSEANYDCFLVDYEETTNLMQEIFRLREESFRSVGEGTGKSFDMDEFDHYYKHVVLWDNTNHKIVGGFRFGIGKEILQSRGVNGFIFSTLFDIDASFSAYLEKTLELGRFFIAIEYQQKGLPLQLLLRTIFVLAAAHPEAEYYIGPVSVSNWYPKFYQGLIMEYLSKKHPVEPKLADMLKPHHPFQPDFLKVDIDALLKSNMDSIEAFDKFLFRLSDGKARVPSLLRKYLRLNAKVIGFNIDTNFNNSFDALLFAKISDFPEKEVLPFF